MKLRLLNHQKIVTFQMQGATKTPSGIFTPYSGVYEYFDCCPVWFADIGRECRILEEGAKIGDVGVIHDAFDLEVIPGYWDEHKHMPEFDLLRQKAEEFDADITTSIIHENSLIAWFKPDPSGGTRFTIGRGETGEFQA